MKRIITSALAIVLLIGTANAQSENKQKHAGRKEHRQMVLKGIDLSVEQKSRVKTINENYRLQIEQLKGQNLTAEQLKTKRQALREQHASDLRGVLTVDQKAKLQSLRKEQKKGATSKGKIDRKGSLKEAPLARERSKDQRKELNLSDDQKAKMKTLNASYKAKLETLRSDRAQSKEAQKSKFQALKKERQESIKAILTAEQQAKMLEYRKRSMAVTK